MGISGYTAIKRKEPDHLEYAVMVNGVRTYFAVYLSNDRGYGIISELSLEGALDGTCREKMIWPLHVKVQLIEAMLEIIENQNHPRQKPKLVIACKTLLLKVATTRSFPRDIRAHVRKLCINMVNNEEGTDHKRFDSQVEYLLRELFGE